MTEAATNVPEKQVNPIKTIKDVLFYYTSVSYACKQLNKENKPPLSDNPLEFHAWEIKILLSETKFKGFKKAFKGAKNLPNAKEFTAEECVEKLGFDELPDEDYVLIKFSQACLVGMKGARKDARPVKQIGIAGKVQDRNGLTIDATTQIGNGTKGHFQFKPVETKNGLYLYPVCVCVTELVEYTGGGANEVDEEAFGIEELAEVNPDDVDTGTADDFDGEVPAYQYLLVRPQLTLI